MSEVEPCACAEDPWLQDPATAEPCPWCRPPEAGASIHGVAVAFGDRSVLLRGPSGIGKSDLALRLLALGADLVADDRVVLAPDPGDAEGLLLAPAPALAGLIEVRGLGPRLLPHRTGVPLALVADLVPSDEVERWPAARRVPVGGRVFPALTLAPREASTPLKLALALGIPPWGGKTMPVGCKGESMSVPVHAPAGAGIAAPAEPGSAPSAAGMAGASGSEAEKAAARPRPSIVLVTGMSGAGRSTSLKMLEDIGYEAIDNLPLSLLPRLVGAERDRLAVAVGIDVRTRDFNVAGLLAEIDRLIESERLDARLLFLDCDDEALARRYTETRRRHPLAIDRPVMDGIRHERQRVALLRDRADLVIDTSTLRPADLKRLLTAQFGLAGGHGLSIFVSSFSFRQGLPREADLVIDARFLDNPYYDPELRPLTGKDPAVQAHIAADPAFPGFIEGLKSWLRPLLPRYSSEGKSYLTIAVGCTGGRHRSVYAAECLAQWLQDEGWAVTLSHRDITRPLNHLAAAAETASAADSAP